MSLDNFVSGKKSTVIKKELIKKETPKKSIKISETPLLPSNLNHHFLRCKNGKCKFERRLRKKTLEKMDYICEKCKSEMIEYTPRKITAKEKMEEEIEE